MPLLPSRSRETLSWNMFIKTDSGDHLLVLPPYYANLFSAYFPDIMRHSRAGFQDTKTGNNKRAFFRRLDEGDVEKIEKFIGYYKDHVVIGSNRHIEPFFDDELDFCLALDYGRSDPKATERTQVGQWEYEAKYEQDEDARSALGKAIAKAVRSLPPPIFTRPRRITYVPSDHGKGFYLPAELAESVVEELPSGFWRHDDPLIEPSLQAKKKSAKNLSVQQKIKQWDTIVDDEQIELSDDIEGHSICVIDDLYQSGASLWSFAKYLKQQGAAAVLGVVCVKSLRDTDNQ